MTHLIATDGLSILFAAVALESAAMPVPGEASLIAASALASRGDFHIGTVIGIAATAAIAGDNMAYVLGRWGGPRLLERWGPLRRFGERVLPTTERFFARYGGAAVFSPVSSPESASPRPGRLDCRAWTGGASCSGTRWERSYGLP